MIPETGNKLQKDFIFKELPSKTFRLRPEDGRIIGHVDGLEAVRQAVYCILNTERYDWLIYSWNYGIQMKDLYGRPIPLVKARIKRRIKEALMQDGRISGVDAFAFESAGRRLHVNFTVHTTEGDIQAKKEVKV